MRSTGRRVGVIAAWTAAAVLGVGAVAATSVATSVAFADPTPTPSSSATAKPDGDRTDRAGKGESHRKLRDGRLARLGGRALHGEFVVKDKDGKFVTLLSQRGEVTAVDSGSITLKSEDGFTKSYTVNDDTKVRRNHDQAEIGDVKVGDKAAVVAVKDGDGGTARTVIAHVPGDD
jgi:hypothetical protein